MKRQAHVLKAGSSSSTPFGAAVGKRLKPEWQVDSPIHGLTDAAVS